MGYTHYFRQHRSLSQPEWQGVINAFAKLLRNLPEHSMSAGGYYKEVPLVIRGLTGTCEPIINDRYIAFNGDEGTLSGLESMEHESMVLNRIKDAEDEDSRWFCKSARKPYDLVVCALLIVVANIATDAYKMGSDGGPEDWEPSLAWVNEVLGEHWRLPKSIAAQKNPIAA